MIMIQQPFTQLPRNARYRSNSRRRSEKEFRKLKKKDMLKISNRTDGCATNTFKHENTSGNVWKMQFILVQKFFEVLAFLLYTFS